MERLDLDKIEQYLLGKMNHEEEQLFVEELRASEHLREATRLTAYFIASFQRVGQKRDAERIAAIRGAMRSDNQKYWMSVAAMFVAVLSFAAITSVPVYKYVVKPVIEQHFKKTNPKPDPVQPIENVLPVDTLLIDTLSVGDTVKVVPDTVARVIKPVQIKKEAPKPDTPVVKPIPVTVVPADTFPQPKPAVIIAPPPAPNRIVTYNRLTNYVFSDVQAVRKGNQVICSFTMTNMEENADVQMHSARAKDENGKNYPAKLCLLNGSSKRIKESWVKGRSYQVEISVNEVAMDVMGFEFISFSFQSDGDELKQKSQSIVLKVGKIE